MVNRTEMQNVRSFLRSRVTALFIIVVSFCLSGIGVTDAAALSDNHAINIDPASRNAIGEKVWGEINRFFVEAETAIETENLEAMMGLYSEHYANGPQTKKSVRQIWKRLFKQTNDALTVHNMRFITTSRKSNVMIIRCSGLLMGIPTGERNLITLDNWTDSDHILQKEDGKWKLIGTTGKETKRFWFDKPMHPLF